MQAKLQMLTTVAIVSTVRQAITVLQARTR